MLGLFKTKFSAVSPCAIQNNIDNLKARVENNVTRKTLTQERSMGIGPQEVKPT